MKVIQQEHSKEAVVVEISYLPQDEWMVTMQSAIKLVRNFASLEQEQTRTMGLQGWHPGKTKVIGKNISIQLAARIFRSSPLVVTRLS